MSRSFVKFVFTLLIIVGVTNISRAQDEANIIRPSTKSGSAAWIFSFGGLANLGMTGVPIADGVVGAGMKYYLSDDLALRAILGLSTTSSGDADLTKSPTGKNSSFGFGIGVGIEMHTRAVYSISPYFGAQLNFATSSSTNSSTTAGTTTETKTSSSGLGIGVMAGFDYYFTHAIAVGGEYTLGFGTNSSSRTAGGTTTDAPSSSNIGIANGSVHLIVHF